MRTRSHRSRFALIPLARSEMTPLARSYGRVFPSIWNDEDFRDLTMEARLMYVFLLSQPDLAQSGVIPFRTRRWARLLDTTPADVERLCAELEAAWFVVADIDTEELLVRSLMRNDEVWKQPNVFKAAASSATGCESARLKAVLLAEAQRLDPSLMKGEARHVHSGLLASLEPFAKGSPNPSRTLPEGRPVAAREERQTPETDIRAVTGSTAGQDPSRTLPEPFAKGSSEVRGKVPGNGIHNSSPLPLNPPPSPRPRAARDGGLPESPGEADPDPEGEGEGHPDERTPGAIDALVAEVRAIRPDWAPRSARKALDHPDVRDRAWPIVAEAFRIVARDPATRQPGRLAGDGDWWQAAYRKVRVAIAPPQPPAGHEFTRADNGWCTCGLPADATCHAAYRRRSA